MELCCQILFVDSRDDEVLVDLVPLEPAVATDGEEIPAGLPLTVGLSGVVGLSEYEVLVGTLNRWADEMTVLTMAVQAGQGGQQFVLTQGRERLVLQVPAD